MAELPNPKGDGTTKVNIRYLFAMATDIDAMRHFCTDLIGMLEKSYMNDENFGWLCYQCDGFQLMFFRANDENTKPLNDWTWQPGYGGGPLEGVSWAINYPEEEFRAAVKRMIGDDVRALFEEPQWFQDSYWSFPVMDPMGNTIELYYTPKDKPESPEWQ
ncbi:MAG TPA: VOC family protein [bacterium]|jgi:hypothetical protein